MPKRPLKGGKRLKSELNKFNRAIDKVRTLKKEQTAEEFLKKAIEAGHQRVIDCDFEPTTVTIDLEDIEKYGHLKYMEGFDDGRMWREDDM